MSLFFARTWPSPPKKEREDRSGRYPWANWTRAMQLVHPSLIGVSSWSPKKRRPPPDTLESPRSESQGMPRRSPPPHIAFRRWPYNDAYPQSSNWGTTWDLVGQIFTPFSPGDPTTHPACPPWIIVHPTEEGWSTATQPQRFRRVRTLAHMQGRIVVPPEVSRPGHFDAVPYGTTLAAYPS